MPGIEQCNWVLFALLLLLLVPVYVFIRRARAGHRLFVRRIPGVDAVDEATGRAVEMGRPMMFTTGLVGVNAVLFACLGILKHVARCAAEFGARLIVPQNNPEVMAIVQSTIEETYRRAGKQELYRPEDIPYLSDEQFAFASGYMGITHRERAAACYLFGTFAAESLILAEAGQQVGAVQVAGTTSNEQIPFFITTCDYTIIGEELFATGAYLSRDPVQTGSLRGQDVGKLVILSLIVSGLIWGTIGSFTSPVEIAVWDAGRKAITRTIKGKPGGINDLALIAGTELIATAGEDGSVMLCELPAGKRLISLPGHKGPVLCLDYSEQRHLLASGGQDTLVRLWDVRAAQAKGTRDRSVKAAQRRLDGEDYTLWSQKWQETLPPETTRKKSEQAGELAVAMLSGHNAAVVSLSFGPEGRLLASASRDGTIRLWNTETRASRAIKGHEGGVNVVVFSQDGKLLVSGGEDGIVRAWDPQTSDVKLTFKHNSAVTSVAIAPGTNVIASGGADGAIKLWSTASGQLLHVLRPLTAQELNKLEKKERSRLRGQPVAGHAGQVLSLAFSADGKLLASGGADKRIVLWDVQTGRFKSALVGQTEPVKALEWGPGGKSLYGAGTRRVVQGFDVRLAKFLFGIYKQEEE